MYNIVYKNNILQSFKTKSEAQKELDDRSSMCYMLRVKPSEAYLIKKGKTNAARRNRKKRTMLQV